MNELYFYIYKVAVRTMLMKKIFIVAATCIAIMGCATEGQYRTKMTTFVGQPKEALIAKWGKPTGQYTDENGDEVVSYIKTRDINVPGTPAGSMGFSAVNQEIVIPAMPTSTVYLTCMTQFIVRNGVIQSLTFKGNDCKARDW